MKPYSLEELEEKRRQSLIQSEKGIHRHPTAYLDLKRLLQDVLAHPIDIGDYYQKANELTRLLDTLSIGGTLNIFYHFKEQINPREKGNARYFRFECTDLYEQIQKLEKWRMEQRSMCIVK